jgi:hypothetical protein
MTFLIFLRHRKPSFFRHGSSISFTGNISLKHASFYSGTSEFTLLSFKKGFFPVPVIFIAHDIP